MFNLFKLFMVIALVRLQISSEEISERPWILAILFTIANLVLASLMYADWLHWLGAVGAGFLLSWVYFWQLARLEGMGPLWWFALLLGLPLVMF